MNLSKELLKSFLLQAFSVLVRALFTGVGGALIERGLVTDGQWSTFLLGSASVLTAIVWSLAEKYNWFRYIGLALEKDKTEGGQ